MRLDLSKLSLSKPSRDPKARYGYVAEMCVTESHHWQWRIVRHAAYTHRHVRIADRFSPSQGGRQGGTASVPSLLLVWMTRIATMEGVAGVNFGVQWGHRDQGSYDHHDEGVYRLP